MRRDFTISIYKKLLEQLQKSNYAFQKFESFMGNPKKKVVVLRHDVDRIPVNALKLAQVEQEFGVHASYYFRVVESVWDEEIMNKITELGHEVAYHYEDLTLMNGDFEKAIRHFKQQLYRFRTIYPCKTICMHGSPLSKYDNRLIWNYYDYREFGIVGEPYFDVNYDEVFYITDTGRKWNNKWVSVRDKVNSIFDIPINSTDHIIQLLKEGKMPDKIIINTHPHRWFDNYVDWCKEYLFQYAKNTIKYLLIKKSERRK